MQDFADTMQAESSAFTFHQFAAGAARYGVHVAARAAVAYGVPLPVCLSYVRRFGRVGYVV